MSRCLTCLDDRSLALSNASVSHINGPTIRQLMDLHADALVLYARQWCTDPDDAVQEALIEYSQQTLPPRDPVAWLYAVTRQRAMNLARSEKRRHNHQHRANAGKSDWFQFDPASDLVSQEVEQTLLNLESLDRQIVVARIWGHLSLVQIASLLGLTTSTVHRRYHAAIATLQRKLTPEETPLNESV